MHFEDLFTIGLFGVKPILFETVFSSQRKT